METESDRIKNWPKSERSRERLIAEDRMKEHSRNSIADQLVRFLTAATKSSQAKPGKGSSDLTSFAGTCSEIWETVFGVIDG